MPNLIQQIKTFVEDECKKPTSKYGYEPFPHHFVPMVARAKQLADQLGGDKELIEIAARLHDIGSIIVGREDHHITWAEIAGKKLTELNYPAEKIQLVKKCILHHRGSMNHHRETLEEQIIAEADIMSCFDNLPWLFNAAFTYEKMTQEQARKSVKEKLENKRNQLSFKESKQLIKPKYDAAMLLLNE